MACFHPLDAFRSLTKRTANGKSVIVFKLSDVSSSPFEPIKLPCGQCTGCRIDRAKQWSLRCVHEASLFENNCFITLTFNDDSLDSRGSLVKSDFQKFMKRLRKKFSGIEPVTPADSYDEYNDLVVPGKTTFPIRYFHCGEYGSQLSRPHHHACIFNFDFPDRKLWSVRDGVRLYRSAALEKLWPYGFCTVGDVTLQSAAYVARYILKKYNGDLGVSHYMRCDDDGVVYYLEPEYITMSRRPGIGKRWFELYNSDLFPKDFVTFSGKKFKIPAYYDKIYDSWDPTAFSEIKLKRKLAALDNCDNNSVDRLLTRERVLNSKLKILQRGFEND